MPGTLLSDDVLALVPDPFDVIVLCERVTRMLGRPIEIFAFESNAALPTGLLLSTVDGWQIFAPDRNETSLLHWQHIVLHELGHILGGHRPGQLLTSPVLREIVPDLSDTTLALMARGEFDDAQEEEAEAFACEIGALARRRHPDPIINRALDAYSG